MPSSHLAEQSFKPVTDRGARPDISPQMAAIRAGTTISSINQDALELLDQTGTGTTH